MRYLIPELKDDIEYFAKAMDFHPGLCTEEAALKELDNFQMCYFHYSRDTLIDCCFEMF